MAWRKNGRGDAKARVESPLRLAACSALPAVVPALSAGLRKPEKVQLLQDYRDVLPLLPISDEVWQWPRTAPASVAPMASRFLILTR